MASDTYSTNQVYQYKMHTLPLTSTESKVL